jgi:hypothetical protein
LVNVEKDEFLSKKNKWLPKIEKYLKEKKLGPMMTYSAKYEDDLTKGIKNIAESTST